MGSILLERDLSKVKIPKKTQDIIPIERIYKSGMASHGQGRYSMTYALKEVDFDSANAEGQEYIAGGWANLLDSLDPSKAFFKITVANRRVKKREVLNGRLLPTDVEDGYDGFRIAYNRLRYDDVIDGGFKQEKFITITAAKRKDRAEDFFNRMTRDLNGRLADIDSGVTPLTPKQRMELYHGFLNAGHEEEFNYTWDDKTAHGKFKDYIAPSALKFYADGFTINGKFGRALMIKTLGTEIPGDFITKLADVKTDLMLSVDVIPLSKSEAKRLAETKEADVENSADQWSSSKRVNEGSAVRLPRQIKQDRKVIDEYLEDINERHQKVYLLQVVIAVCADTKDMLDEVTETIKETAGESSSVISTLYFEQLEGLMDAIPFGTRYIENLRDCNTDTAALMLPFSHVTINHEHGIPYGRHEGTKEQQMVDRRQLVNGNEWIFGISGSGKSTNAKLKLVYELLLTDGDVIIADPDGEYAPLVTALGGQVVKVGQDSINIMDMTQGYGDGTDPIQKKSETAINFIESILDSRTAYTETEKSLIDKAVRVYAGAVMDGQAQEFTLSDIYDYLLATGEQKAHDLALAISRHVTGSFNCFARPTSVNLNSRTIDFDLSALPGQLKNGGMLVVLDTIERRLVANRYRGIATYIKLDEIDYYFQHASSAQTIGTFFERVRKYGGFITAIIQNITNLLQNPLAYKMINNAANVIMMKQSELDAKMLADMYGLSTAQTNKLIRAARGHGINKIGDNIYEFDGTIPEDNELYKFVDTNVVKKGDYNEGTV